MPKTSCKRYFAKTPGAAGRSLAGRRTRARGPFLRNCRDSPAESGASTAPPPAPPRPVPGETVPPESQEEGVIPVNAGMESSRRTGAFGGLQPRHSPRGTSEPFQNSNCSWDHWIRQIWHFSNPLQLRMSREQRGPEHTFLHPPLPTLGDVPGS